MSNILRTVRRNMVRLQIDQYNDAAEKKNRPTLKKPSRLLYRIWHYEVKGNKVK